ALGSDVVERVVVEGHGALAGVGRQVLGQPVVLGGAGVELPVLGVGVEADEVPAGGVEAVVVRDVVPVVEVPWGLPILILVVSERRRGDAAEAAVDAGIR